MLKCSFTFIFCLVSLVSFAQKKDTIIYYFNAKLQRVSHRDEAAFGGVMIEQDKKNWALEIFYPTGKPMLTGTFSDKKMHNKNGWFTTYFPSGAASGQGQFEDNEQQGVWKSWYENKLLKDSGNYNNGLKDGLWKTWYENGQLESDGNYAQNLMENNWKWFRENGSPSTVEVYKNNVLTNLTCYNNDGDSTGSFCGIDVPPVFPGGDDSLQSFIIENLYYPDEAVKKRIEGDVSFSFLIKKDGSIGNIIIESSPNELLSNEVKRLLHSMPKWAPAISHNRDINYLEKMTLPFYLDQ